jgi:hypothetical protein
MWSESTDALYFNTSLRMFKSFLYHDNMLEIRNSFPPISQCNHTLTRQRCAKKPKRHSHIYFGVESEGGVRVVGGEKNTLASNVRAHQKATW